MSYKVERYPSAKYATSATTVITPSIDISHFDKICIQIDNSATGNTVVHLLIEHSMFPEATAADTAYKWVPLNTATYLYASAVGNTAAISTVMWDNAFRYIRVSARGQISQSEGFITVRVGGFTRFHN